MDLEWDGSFQVGSPADFILLDADSWTSALSMSPDRKVMINGAWVE
jgi:cytosine deaminase